MSAPGRSKYVPERYEIEDSFDVPSSHEKSSAVVPQVRTLKPPPEIWELVHPVEPKERSSVMALVHRVTSNGTTLMTLVFAALALGAISAFLIVRPDKLEATTSPKLSNSPRTRPAQSSSTATTPATLPADNPSAVDNAAGLQPTIAVSPESAAVLPLTPRKKVKPIKKPDSVAQYAVAERVSNKNSESLPAVENKTEKKNPSDSTAAIKPKANASASTQLLAPAKPSETPKAKVIQWP